jgi:putative tricarboxylic transport membrane protein
MFEILQGAFVELATWQNFMFANFGVLVGIIIGCIPGLSVTLGIILFLPLTFGMNPVTSIVMLLSLYAGGMYGGSISAILINTPGTNSALATTLDGHPLAKQGKALKALQVSLISSVFGGLVAGIVLLVAAPPIAAMALKFGAPEYFCLAVFGLSVIAGVSGKSMLKGIISGMLGVFIAMLGLDSLTGTFRFAFNSTFLIGGIPLLPALIGFIALAEIISKSVEVVSEVRETTARHAKMTAEEIQAEMDAITASKKAQKEEAFAKKAALKTMSKEERRKAKAKLDENNKLTFKEFVSLLGVLIKSSLISIVIGAMPGAGGGIAQFVSYNEAKRSSKQRHLFGKGSLEGLAAAESSNNAVVGSAMIPLLTLGIPGDGVTAILLGAFMMQGLVPGPTLFTEQANITYAIIIGVIISNLLVWAQGHYLTQAIARIVQVPYEILGPILMIFCFAGAYSNSGNINELIMAVPIAIFGYFINKLGFSVVPLMLGLILGPIVEQNFTRSMIMSEGSLSIFVTRPISIAFLVITVIFVYIFTKMNQSENSMLSDEGAAQRLKESLGDATIS